jgi:hypothetical protein
MAIVYTIDKHYLKIALTKIINLYYNFLVKVVENFGYPPT